MNVSLRGFLAGAALLLAVAVARAAAAQAQPAPAVPAPSPTAPAQAGPGDPCTALLAVVNRPTVATGSCVFKNGRGDIETGYTNTVVTGQGASVTAAYPQTFIRAGTFVRNVELDVTPPTAERSSSGGVIQSGAADAAYGLKWEMGYTSKAVYSIDASATVPTGDRAFTAGGSSYTAGVNGSYTLSPEFGLSASLAFESLAAPGLNSSVQRQGVFVPALEVSAALPASAQLYAEISNVSHAAVGAPARTLYDFGFQKQFSAHWQVDVETGLAPAPAAGQKLHYLGFGIAFGNI